MELGSTPSGDTKTNVMKRESDPNLGIYMLNGFIRTTLPHYLDKNKDHLWQSLDIDYHPPRVERLYMDVSGYRIYLHTIHKTDEECLYHKHRWPSAIRLLKGSYEMGLTYSEEEVPNEEAHAMPNLCKMVLTEGSSYEMMQTDALHYVKPISDLSYSVMLTRDYYPEAVFRKESLDKPLKPLTEVRKQELLTIFRMLLAEGYLIK